MKIKELKELQVALIRHKGPYNQNNSCQCAVGLAENTHGAHIYRTFYDLSDTQTMYLFGGINGIKRIARKRVITLDSFEAADAAKRIQHMLDWEI